MSTHQSKPSSAARGAAPAALPVIEIRLTAIYAWLLIGFGVIFFLLAFLVGSKNAGLGFLIAVLSVAGVLGGNYWRHHLHVVARMTPRQLVLHRGGTVSWSDIAAIEKKTIRLPYKGVSHESAYVCIKLKTPRKSPDKLQGFLDTVKKAALGGYDIVVPDSELSCSVDWFIAECTKRMTAVAGAA
jgi:hypothetical protein